MLNRNRVLSAFQRAIVELVKSPAKAKIRPRTVAVVAHRLYCEECKPIEHRPSAETFRKFSTGQLPFPEVIALLRVAGIHPRPRSRLDREKLRSVFVEAIGRLETRLIKGQARPLQVARRAHELYARSLEGSLHKPSHRTFEDMIYGKSADPEIVELFASTLRKNEKPEGA